MAFDTLTQTSFKLVSIHADPLDFDLAWFLRVFSTPWLYVAMCGYLGAFISWMTLLKHAPIGPAFAASHLELVSVTLISVWLFHEPLNVYKIVGGILIILGVLCLAKNEGSDAVSQPKSR